MSKQPKPDLCPETLRWVTDNLSARIVELGTNRPGTGYDYGAYDEAFLWRKKLSALATRAEKKRGKQR